MNSVNNRAIDDNSYLKKNKSRLRSLGTLGGCVSRRGWQVVISNRVIRVGVFEKVTFK